MKLHPATIRLLQVARWHRQELPPNRLDFLAESIREHRADGYRVRARLFPAKDLRAAVLALEWTRKKRRI